MKRRVLQLVISVIILLLKKFNHRRTKYCYFRNPNAEKGDYFLNVTLCKENRWMKRQVSIVPKFSIFQVLIVH